MRLGFDMGLLSPPLTGVGRYAAGLLLALRRASPAIELRSYRQGRWLDLPDERLRAIFMGDDAPPRNKPALSVRSIALAGLEASPAAHALWSRIARARFRLSVARRPVDLYYALNFMPPSAEALPFVSVVHDLSPLTHPETHPASRVRWMANLQHDLRRASAVQAVSRFSADELTRVLGVEPDRIHIVNPIVDDVMFEPPQDIAATLQRHGLAQGRYILCVGTREPRKNLATAVAAYAGLPGPLRDQLPLVLIGARGWGDEDWAKRHQPLVSAGQVRLLGYVPRLELRDILSGAGLVAYPSLYEGFGMPVAEASACGAPVAISDCPALGEAAGVGQGVSVCEGVSVTAARDVDGWRAVFAAVAEGPPRLAPIPARRDAAERFRAHVQAERALRVLSIAAIATGGGNG